MKDNKIAVFFDCENIPSKHVPSIFDELANYGEVIIKQSFKDWESQRNKSWDKSLHEKFAIEAIHVFNSMGCKNTSDLRIQRAVIETMHQKNIDIIVLVSSDSDFRDLVINTRANGYETIGFGESKTKDSLKNSYSTFIELPLKKETKNNEEIKLITLLKDAINNVKKEDEYCSVSELGSYLKNKNSSYISKNFGYETWGKVFKKYPDFFELCHLDKRKSTLIVKVK